MKTIKTLQTLALAVLFMAFISCSSDDDNTPITDPVQAEQVSNLFAPQTGGQGTGQDEGGHLQNLTLKLGQKLPAIQSGTLPLEVRLLR